MLPNNCIIKFGFQIEKQMEECDNIAFFHECNKNIYKLNLCVL